MNPSPWHDKILAVRLASQNRELNLFERKIAKDSKPDRNFLLWLLSLQSSSIVEIRYFFIFLELVQKINHSNLSGA